MNDSPASVVDECKHELPLQLVALRDFYYGTRELPAQTIMLRVAGLIDKPAFFSLAHLQRHLNNPFLTPDWFSLIWQGKTINCSPAIARKRIRGSEVSFLNKGIIQEALSHGASLVLEGIEFLEPDINAMCAAIDRVHERAASNAVVFFSQRGMEAYRGHFDAQDTLVIHLSGQKKWRIHDRLPPRRINRGELTAQQMGRVQAEITMNPGDALFLRSGTPHIVETTGSHSLHMSFDICDHTVGANAMLDMLVQHANGHPAPPYTPLNNRMARLADFARSPECRERLDAMQAARTEADRRLRAGTADKRVRFLDQWIGVEKGCATGLKRERQ